MSTYDVLTQNLFGSPGFDTADRGGLCDTGISCYRFFARCLPLEAKSVKRIDAKSVMCKDFEPLLLAAPLCPVSSIFGMLPNGLKVTVLG